MRISADDEHGSPRGVPGELQPTFRAVSDEASDEANFDAANFDAANFDATAPMHFGRGVLEDGGEGDERWPDDEWPENDWGDETTTTHVGPVQSAPALFVERIVQATKPLTGWIAARVIEPTETAVLQWMRKRGALVAQLGVGFVYLWFGALKFFPDLSPTEALVRETLSETSRLTGIPIPITLTFIAVGAWEAAIGIGLLSGSYRRAALWMLLLHLPFTLLPTLVASEMVWEKPPIGLTADGQYMLTNLVLFVGATAIGATLRPRTRPDHDH